VSTEFKKGDRVLVKPGQIWQWNNALPNDPALVVTKTEGDSVHYRYESIEGEHRRDTELFTERAHLVTDTTPAPLDPSKVKPGDTVTLTVDPPDTHPAFTVAGETHSLGGSAVYVGGWRVDDLPDYVTLTDHQPAPEPEPAPGYYTVHPTANPEAAWTGLVFEDGSFVGEEDGFYRSASKGEFSVSGRLVVIDPADVDVVELSKAAWDRWNGQPATESSNAHFRDAVRAVLEHLGLNR